MSWTSLNALEDESNLNDSHHESGHQQILQLLLQPEDQILDGTQLSQKQQTMRPSEQHVTIPDQNIQRQQPPYQGGNSMSSKCSLTCSSQHNDTDEETNVSVGHFRKMENLGTESNSNIDILRPFPNLETPHHHTTATIPWNFSQQNQHGLQATNQVQVQGEVQPHLLSMPPSSFQILPQQHNLPGTIKPLPPTLDGQQLQQLKEGRAKMMLMTIVNPSSSMGAHHSGNSHSQLVLYFPQVPSQNATSSQNAGDTEVEGKCKQASLHNPFSSQVTISSKVPHVLQQQQPQSYPQTVDQNIAHGGHLDCPSHCEISAKPSNRAFPACVPSSRHKHPNTSNHSSFDALLQAKEMSDSMSLSWNVNATNSLHHPNVANDQTHFDRKDMPRFFNEDNLTAEHSTVDCHRKDESDSLKVPIKLPSVEENTIVRPLSAYNFFFSEERERMLHGRVFFCNSYEERKHRLLTQHLTKDRTKRRPHRKTHGKINFTSLSKLIGQRWRKLPDSEKSFYKMVAEADLKRYQGQLAALNAKTKKFTPEPKLQQKNDEN